MDTSNSTKYKSQKNRLDIFNSCLKKKSYVCMHVHIRHINNVDLDSIFNTTPFNHKCAV